MPASAAATKLHRMSKLMLARPYRYWLVAALIAALMYDAWGQLTRTRGDQNVSFRPAEQACGMSGSLRYCVYRDRRGTNGDIVYHLHGRNLDERIWNDGTYFTALIQAEWQRRRELPPTVITLSYGSTWLLTPKGEKPDSGLLNDLMGRLPAIEAKVGVPRRRILMGESMGGLNVLIARPFLPSAVRQSRGTVPRCIFGLAIRFAVGNPRGDRTHGCESKDRLRRVDDGAEVCG